MTETITIVTIDEFARKLVKHGAELVDDQQSLDSAEMMFFIEENSLVSKLCVACYEFLLCAARNSGHAIELIDKMGDDRDPHYMTALRKYVEDTGMALKEVDSRLKKVGSSLEGLFPDFNIDPASPATWRSIIARRDVIAHRLLSIDNKLIYEGLISDGAQDDIENCV